MDGTFTVSVIALAVVSFTAAYLGTLAACRRWQRELEESQNLLEKTERLRAPPLTHWTGKPRVRADRVWPETPAD